MKSAVARAALVALATAGALALSVPAHAQDPTSRPVDQPPTPGHLACLVVDEARPVPAAEEDPHTLPAPVGHEAHTLPAQTGGIQNAHTLPAPAPGPRTLPAPTGEGCPVTAADEAVPLGR